MGVVTSDLSMKTRVLFLAFLQSFKTWSIWSQNGRRIVLGIGVGPGAGAVAGGVTRGGTPKPFLQSLIMRQAEDVPSAGGRQNYCSL